MALRLCAGSSRLKLVEWTEDVSHIALPSRMRAATIGVFDGLHVGHQALVAKVVAKSPELEPLAVTFKDNPKKVMRSRGVTGSIFSLEQKLDALALAGIKLCALIDFSGNFSKMSGSEFVSTLVRSFGVCSFIVGDDFKCGHGLSTDAQALSSIAWSLGAEACIIKPVMVHGHAVSSSRIRSAIMDGRTDLALAMLGRPYTLDLRSIETELQGSAIVASLKDSGFVEPAVGTYRAMVGKASEQREVIVSMNQGSTLAWPSNGDVFSANPEFLAFGPKIA